MVVLRQDTPPVIRVVIGPVLGLWLVVVASLLGGLLAFHCMLMYNDQTTHEYLKGEAIDPMLRRPVSRVLYERFFAPIPKR